MNSRSTREAKFVSFTCSHPATRDVGRVNRGLYLADLVNRIASQSSPKTRGAQAPSPANALRSFASIHCKTFSLAK